MEWIAYYYQKNTKLFRFYKKIILELINNNNIDILSKDKIEQVQKKKTEYKLLGTFMRTKGLNLFSYNSITGELELLKIKYSKQVIVIPDGLGGLTYFDPEKQKTNIDSRNTHFEALNYKSAKERVLKFKQGKIKELFNLKKPCKKSIDFW